MTKLILTNPTTFVADASAVAQAATNNAAIVAALENTLSRDGTTPNQMGASFDMNSNRILNLPAPLSNNEPARLIDVGNAPVSATAAAASATAAAASATQAQTYITGLSSTSTTSLLIATGAKAFVTQAGKNFTTGQFVTASSNANSANYMHGTVTTYSGTSLILNVLDVGGSGTLADWNINVAGTQGAQGAPGSGTIAGATNHGVAIATGASAVTSTAVMSNGQLLIGQTGADPIPTTVSGDITVSAAGVTAIKTGVALTSPTTNTLNGNTFTTGTYTLTGVAGKTFTFSNTLTLSGTDGSTLAVGVGGTLTGSSSAAVWYDNIPQNSKSAAYTTVLADANKHILHPTADTTARTFTIDSNANVAYPVGTAITFVNQHSAGLLTIAITTDTMRLAGSGLTGARTLAADGLATALKLTTTEWIISGPGLT